MIGAMAQEFGPTILSVLPTSFDLTFDNFRTRKCRLIWRRGDFLGVAFEN